MEPTICMERLPPMLRSVADGRCGPVSESRCVADHSTVSSAGPLGARGASRGFTKLILQMLSVQRGLRGSVEDSVILGPPPWCCCAGAIQPVFDAATLHSGRSCEPTSAGTLDQNLHHGQQSDSAAACANARGLLLSVGVKRYGRTVTEIVQARLRLGEGRAEAWA